MKQYWKKVGNLEDKHVAKTMQILSRFRLLIIIGKKFLFQNNLGV